MGLFSGLFLNSKKSNYKFSEEPQIFFGCYTDRNKTKLQYDHWEKSLQQYKDKKYLNAYEHFFHYLEDVSMKNVLFERDNNRINFEFVQGSKIVKGSVNDQEIFAEAEVVRFDDISTPVMRTLLRENSKLYYSKFAIKNDIYSLKYFSPVEDASPKSLYNALRELATEADLFDDVLIDEFDDVHPINMEHIKEISIEEKQLKLKYFRIWLNQTLQKVNSLETEQDVKGVFFILQTLLYKIYYLLAPQGVLLSDINDLQEKIPGNEGDTIKELNISIIAALKEIREKTDDELMKSLYRVEATFAVTRPASFSQVKSFINDKMKQTNDFIAGGQLDDAFENCEYILSYSSFSFGMPAVANDLLHVVWRIFHTSFFKDLGFVDEYYLEEDRKFNVELINAKIRTIISNAKKQYAKIKFKPENLDFSDKLKFSVSFFNEFQRLNYD